VKHQARLVVDDAASVEATVAPVRRLEGRRLPALRATRWLNVVMGVDQNGGGLGTRAEPLPDDTGLRTR
jgi:hypothetical protein